jgi:HK97 family phage portal protein
MIGFPTDGGLVAGGVTTMTSIGISAVWRCLDVLANGISQLEWNERRGNLVLPPSRIVIRPQARRTRREWTSLVVSTLALFDVCYILKVGGEDAEGVPIGLWPLDPSIVAPYVTDFLSAASFLPPDDFYVAQMHVTRDELVILHRSPQPTIQDTVGGVLKLARATFAAAIAAEGYASRYWQAGGAPTTVLETDAALDETSATQLSERWTEKRSRGPDYAPVLSSGLKAKSFGADPTTESAVEARRELVADIGRYFGIPTRILNAPTSDTETYKNASSANQDLVRYTLQNYIDAIQDGITDLLPGGRRMLMDTDTLTRPTLLERSQAWQLAGGAKAWMTPDEIREEEELPPIESPDELNPAPPPAIAASAAGGFPNGG